MNHRFGLLALLLSLTLAAPVQARGLNAADDTSSEEYSEPVEVAEPAPESTEPVAEPAEAAAPVEEPPVEEAAPVEEAPVEEAAVESDPYADSGDGDEEVDEESTPSALAGRPWYFSPMFSYTMADDSRGTDDGIGATIGLGKKVTDGLALELTGFFTQMDPETGNGDVAELKGAGLSALVFPSQTLPDLFVLLSLMHGGTSNHPGPIPNYQETVFDAGLGYLIGISERVLIRLEARYRTDQHGREAAGTTPDQNKNFYDGVFNIGLLIPLGTKTAVAEDGADVVDPNSLDSDNDGVPDATDECPGTPAGAVVDARGCEGDSDGDGVPDRLDKCPDTPVGQAVNGEGCPLDSDGDGVPDDVDECPNSPAGAKVLQNGCALKGDCRRPRPGEQVDENGCAVEQKFILKGVKFEFDSDRLTEEAKRILVEVAATLQAYPDISVELQGHTDGIGTDAYNQGLSERRANAVKTFLTGQGIDAARMTPAGYGEAQPIETNDTEEGREANRRVELKVLE